jgi:carbamoyl-phosphate synthase small subunit
MRAVLSTHSRDAESLVTKAGSLPEMVGLDLASTVTCSKTYEWTEPSVEISTGRVVQGSARFHVVAYDYGLKQNILRRLVDVGCRVTVVPALTLAQDVLAMKPDGVFLSNGPGDPEPCTYCRVTVVPALTLAQDVLAMKPDGVFLSNGPGDPEPCTYAVEAVRKLAGRIPIFGICLGHQIIGLALGGKTYKLKFGHHGANHPVKNLLTGSQPSGEKPVDRESGSHRPEPRLCRRPRLAPAEGR